jgi:broad specificity phosphatase PhoE
MARVFLVRHAQASFGSSDYDRLSDLGHEQSGWLGEYFLERGTQFSKVLAGTLKRQQQTAQGVLAVLGLDPSRIVTHAGLDEYHGAPVYAAYTGGADPVAQQKADYRAYWKTFRQALQAWSENKLMNIPETWDGFALRVRQAITEGCAGMDREDEMLIVSSGGSISRLLVDITGASAQTAIDMNLHFRNTGFCELIVNADQLRVTSFNNIPHLERSDRRGSITFA